MALFGFQVIVTMCMASFMAKLHPTLSVLRYVVNKVGLVRYIHPMELADLPADDRQAHHARHQRKQTKTACQEKASNYIECQSVDPELISIPVTCGQLSLVKFFNELMWLVDFSSFALFVHLVTEVYFRIGPVGAASEFNLATAWSLVVVSYTLSVMCVVTRLYFADYSGLTLDRGVTSTEHKASSRGVANTKKQLNRMPASSDAEGSIVLVSFSVSLLVCMICLTVDDSILESGLHDAYVELNRTASVMSQSSDLGLDYTRLVTSETVVKFVIALLCALFGALAAFPGLRFSRSYLYVSRASESDDLSVFSFAFIKSTVVRTVNNGCLLLPFVATLLWIRPLSRNLVGDKLTDVQFDAIRIFVLLLTAITRIVMVMSHLQSFFDLAMIRLTEIRRSGGRIARTDFRQSVSGLFPYACVVGIQLLAPAILLLHLTLTWRWFSLTNMQSFDVSHGTHLNGLHHYFRHPHPNPGPILEIPVAAKPVSISPASLRFQTILSDPVVGSTVRHLSQAWAAFKEVVGTNVFTSILSFVTWWTCLVMSMSSSLGLFYHSYLTA